MPCRWKVVRSINVKSLNRENNQMETYSMFAKTLSTVYLMLNRYQQTTYQVIKDASRMMSDHGNRCVNFEFCQTTFDMGNEPSKLPQLITSKGYKLRNLVKSAPIFPGGASAATAQLSIHICTPSP